jgi:hypothetical protein
MSINVCSDRQVQLVLEVRLYDVIWLLQIEMISYQESEDSLRQQNIDSFLMLFD